MWPSRLCVVELKRVRIWKYHVPFIYEVAFLRRTLLHDCRSFMFTMRKERRSKKWVAFLSVSGEKSECIPFGPCLNIAITIMMLDQPSKRDYWVEIESFYIRLVWHRVHFISGQMTSSMVWKWWRELWAMCPNTTSIEPTYLSHIFNVIIFYDRFQYLISIFFVDIETIAHNPHHKRSFITKPNKPFIWFACCGGTQCQYTLKALTTQFVAFSIHWL